MGKAAKRNVWADPVTAKARIAELEAENAGIGDLYLEIDRLEAKVGRLESALMEIVDRWYSTNGVVLSKDIGKAKTALEGKQDAL